MKDRQEDDTIRAKKPYVKPEVKQVHLRPEEAVLGFCKTSLVVNPNVVATCDLPKCHALGS